MLARGGVGCDLSGLGAWPMGGVFPTERHRRALGGRVLRELAAQGADLIHERIAGCVHIVDCGLGWPISTER